MTPTLVSNNLLTTVARCSTATVLRYVHERQTREESAFLKAGSAIHSALEVFFKGGSRGAAMGVLRLAYMEWAEENIDPEDRYLGRLSWENVSLVMRYLLEQHPVASFPFAVDPTCVEVSFEVPLTKSGDVLMRGIIDVGPVRSKKTKKLYGVDHKTTGYVNAQFLQRFRMDAQISDYQWAMQELTPEPVAGMYINAIQLAKLPGLTNPERKCGEHKLPYEECQEQHVVSQLIGPIERSPQQIKEWKRDAIRLSRRYEDLCYDYPKLSDIQKVPQEGKFNGECSRCEFADFCYIGRPPDRLMAMTVKRERREENRS